MENLQRINLVELVMAVVRKWWLILICMVLFGTASYIYTANFETPMYSASVTLYVNNGKTNSSSINAADLATSQRLVLTYVNILKSDSVLSKVAETVEGNVTAGQIKGMMNAYALDETEVFKVTISNSDPEKAADIANAIAEVAPLEIENIISGSSTKIVDKAKVPTVPYAPDKSGSAVKGAVIGAALAVMFALLQALLDVRVKNEEDLERICDAPILGVIPDLTSVEPKNPYSYEPNKSATPEDVEQKEKDSEVTA